MPGAVIRYDKDLPEVEGYNPYHPPSAHLVKDAKAPEGYRLVEGRRPTSVLLVNSLRRAVDRWREEGYPGASSVTARLFNFWFEEDHAWGDGVWRYYFAQREALETLAYLIEIEKNRDAVALVRSFGEVFYLEGSQKELAGEDIKFQTLMDGTRQIERYFPERGVRGVQPLPAEDLRRYAVKMATGSGKTVVMAMTIIWSCFHKRMVPGSPLSQNFLILAPNVIVYQRLEKDFDSNRIFHELPLIPPEWNWELKVIKRGESAEPGSGSNLFLTNIQQIYMSRERLWTPANAVESLLGPKPSQELPSYERSMLERVKSFRDLVVLNDEAHHVHDEDLEWSKTLFAIHEALPNGLNLWLDFTATPKFQDGSYFPWCIVDYPLAQAVEDRIVKAPLIVHTVDKEDPKRATGKEAVEKFGEWVVAAVARYREHEETFVGRGVKPVLFIMCENNAHADSIGEWLRENDQFGFRGHEALIIHTDSTGEVRAGDVEIARETARDIDLPKNKTKVIVSVMMLREGWDVRSVTIVLGLRPFTSKANILPEQAVGRGLRLMGGIGPLAQTLEVIGTRNFEEFVHELETEGVGIETVTGKPPDPVWIEALKEREAYDIGIPITEPVLSRAVKRIDDFDPYQLSSLYEQKDLEEPRMIRLKMDFAQLDVEVHQANIALGPAPLARELIASLTNKVIDKSRLGGGFARLYPRVRDYLRDVCFDRTIHLDNEVVRSNLNDVMVQEAITDHLAREIGKLTLEVKPLTFRHRAYRLSETKPFQWRRDLSTGPLECRHTIFNYVATYNPYERRFAQFLDACPDILRFASLGSTKQGTSGSQFKVDYLKPSGAIGFYYPDFVAVQQADGGEVNWIIETKGRVWQDTEAKDRAMMKWCHDIEENLGEPWRFFRVNQPEFREAQRKKVQGFKEFLDHIRRENPQAVLLQ